MRQVLGSGLNSQELRPLAGLWDQRTPQREGLGDMALPVWPKYSTIRQSSETLAVWAGPSF